MILGSFEAKLYVVVSFYVFINTGLDTGLAPVAVHETNHYSWWRHQMETRYWSFVRGIHRPPVNSPHKGQWRRALMFSLICVWINGWVNNREAGDLGRYHVHYDVIVMLKTVLITTRQATLK